MWSNISVDLASCFWKRDGIPASAFPQHTLHHIVCEVLAPTSWGNAPKLGRIKTSPKRPCGGPYGSHLIIWKPRGKVLVVFYLNSCRLCTLKDDPLWKTGRKIVWKEDSGARSMLPVCCLSNTFPRNAAQLNHETVSMHSWAPRAVPPPFLCRRPLLHWIKFLGSENWSRMSGIPQTKGSYFLRYKDPHCTQQAQILRRVKEKWRGSRRPTSFSRGNWITLEFADRRESLERTEVTQRKDRRWMHFLCASAGKDSLSDVTPDIRMSASDTEHRELCVVPFAVGMLRFITAGPHWKTFKIRCGTCDHTHTDMTNFKLHPTSFLRVYVMIITTT